jgi:hypothetical protein
VIPPGGRRSSTASRLSLLPVPRVAGCGCPGAFSSLREASSLVPRARAVSLKLADSFSTAWSLSCRSRGWPDAGPGAPAPEPACSCTRDRTGRSAPGPLAVPFASLRAIDTPARLARPGPAGAGANGHPRHRRINDTPAHQSEVVLKDERPDIAHSQRQDRGLTGGWWPKPPSGRRPMAPSVRVPSGQSGGWKRWPRPSVVCEGGERRGSARRSGLLGRTRRRVGGRRSMRRPSDTAAARGAKQESLTQ